MITTLMLVAALATAHTPTPSPPQLVVSLLPPEAAQGFQSMDLQTTTATTVAAAAKFAQKAAPLVWATYVRQQYVDGIVSPLMWGLLGLGCALLWRKTWLAYVGIDKAARKRSLDQHGSERYADTSLEWGLMRLAPGVFTALAAVIFWVNLILGVKAVLNPEYEAIKEIAHLVRGG